MHHIHSTCGLILQTLSNSWFLVSQLQLDSMLLIVSSLQFILYPVTSTPSPTTDGGDSQPTPSPTEDPGQYTAIYITIIIIFSILFIVVICCMVYRIYKKRRETQNENTLKKPNHSSTNRDSKQSNGAAVSVGDTSEEAALAQVKFRGGSMSSVENRHERVPSKPVVIAITTPKGTRHVADAFGDYAHAAKQKEDELPCVDENTEEDYDDGNKNENNTNEANGDGDQ